MSNLLWDELYQEPEEVPADDRRTHSREGVVEQIADTTHRIMRETPNVIVTTIDADNIDEIVEETLEKKKAGPVVQKRKREGIQLCKVFDPAKPPKFKEAIFEPKFDGYRCIARVKDGKAELLTSTGLPHWNVDHIKEQLERAAKDAPIWCDNIVLDGEIVHIGFGENKLPFDVAGGILRKHEPDPRAKGFCLMAWDHLSVEEFDTKTCKVELAYRKENLTMCLERLCGDVNYLNYVFAVKYETGPVSDVMKHLEKQVEDGQEGVIIKDAGGMYEFRKSGTWLKLKPFKEGDFRVEGAVEGRGKQAGMLGALKIYGYLLDDGNISPVSPNNPDVKTISSEVGTGFDDAQRKQFWAWFNEGTLVGRTVEVQYQEISLDGALRFPSFKRLREDKDQ